MEAHHHLLFRNLNIRLDIDQVAEDDPGLGIRVASHAPGCQAIEAIGDDEKDHVEVHFEANGGGEGVRVEEADGVRKSVLDEHGGPGSFDFLGFTHYWCKSRKGNTVRENIIDILVHASYP